MRTKTRSPRSYLEGLGDIPAARVAQWAFVGGIVAMWAKGWAPSLLNAALVGRGRRFGLTEGSLSSVLGQHVSSALVLVTFGCLLATIALSVSNFTVARVGPAGIMLALWVLIYLYHGADLAADSLLFPLFVVAFALVEMDREAIFRVIAWAGVLSAAMAVVLGLVGGWGFMPELWSSGADKAIVGDHILAGAYDHSNSLGQVIVLTLPIAIWVLRGWGRWLATAVMLFAIVWSASRISIAVGVGAAILSLIVLPRARKWMGWVATAVVSAATALLIVVPLVVRDPEFLTNRGFIWVTARNFGTEDVGKFLLGSGGDSFSTISPLTERLDYVSTTGHNLFVTFFICGGILAVVTLFSYLIMGAFQQVKDFHLFPLPLIWLIVYLLISIAEDPTRAFYFGPHAFVVMPMLMLLHRGREN